MSKFSLFLRCTQETKQIRIERTWKKTSVWLFDACARPRGISSWSEGVQDAKLWLPKWIFEQKMAKARSAEKKLKGDFWRSAPRWQTPKDAGVWEKKIERWLLEKCVQLERPSRWVWSGNLAKAWPWDTKKWLEYTQGSWHMRKNWLNHDFWRSALGWKYLLVECITKKDTIMSFGEVRFAWESLGLDLKWRNDWVLTQGDFWRIPRCKNG